MHTQRAMCGAARSSAAGTSAARKKSRRSSAYSDTRSARRSDEAIARGVGSATVTHAA